MFRGVYKAVEKRWFDDRKKGLVVRTYHSRSVKKFTSAFLAHSFAAARPQKTHRFTQAEIGDLPDWGGLIYTLSTNINVANELKGFIK